MKKNYLKELDEIKGMTNIIKKINLNENINFEDETAFEDLYSGNEQEPTNNAVTNTATDDVPTDDVPSEDAQDQCVDGECNLEKKSTEEVGMEELDNMGEVDQIRKITLDGMRKLADHPEDPKFQALLKIFQICNKSVDTKEEEK